MRFEEVIDDFRKGYAIKRKSWCTSMVYVPGDTINLECLLADDWESLASKTDKAQNDLLKKQVELFERCCLSIINEHIKETGCQIVLEKDGACLKTS
jgi:hypothetical protein